MYYQNLFNTQYVNQINYQKIVQDENKFYEEQQKEFANMIKSLNDFFDSASKIAPEYEEQAFNTCLAIIYDRTFGNKK